MLTNISYFPLFGKPLIMYLGVLTLLLILLAASIGVLNDKKIDAVPFEWHRKIAILAIGFALVHGLLGILLYL